jgi:hypothetical protein
MWLMKLLPGYPTLFQLLLLVLLALVLVLRLAWDVRLDLIRMAAKIIVKVELRAAALELRTD